MTNVLLKFATVALAGSLSFSACSEENSRQVGSGPNPFSDCGIGAAIFSETAWAAVTSNVIWDVGTTAVTSATMSPQTCSAKKLKTALFIRDTYDQLAEDLARGNGEHIVTALDMFQCGESRHKVAIGEIRADIGKAVSAPGYTDMHHLDRAGQLYNIIEKATSRSCSV